MLVWPACTALHMSWTSSTMRLGPARSGSSQRRPVLHPEHYAPDPRSQTRHRLRRAWDPGCCSSSSNARVADAGDCSSSCAAHQRASTPLCGAQVAVWAAHSVWRAAHGLPLLWRRPAQRSAPATCTSAPGTCRSASCWMQLRRSGRPSWTSSCQPASACGICTQRRASDRARQWSGSGRLLIHYVIINNYRYRISMCDNKCTMILYVLICWQPGTAGGPSLHVRLSGRAACACCSGGRPARLGGTLVTTCWRVRSWAEHALGASMRRWAAPGQGSPGTMSASRLLC